MTTQHTPGPWTHMTDKQLLEDAAKAAGIEYGWQHIFSDYEGSTADTWDWNPLTDDGDALRLACDLGLQVFPVSRTAAGKACSAVGLFGHGRLSEISDAALDTRAATRRAITRAAAEIGRAMP